MLVNKVLDEKCEDVKAILVLKRGKNGCCRTVNVYTSLIIGWRLGSSLFRYLSNKVKIPYLKATVGLPYIIPMHIEFRCSHIINTVEVWNYL